MKTLKEYAEKHNVSYEAIRKQAERYQEELKGHISIVGRKKYLDEYAEKYLDEKRAVNPVIIADVEHRETMDGMQQEIDNLKLALLNAQNDLIGAKDEIIKLQAAQIELIQEKGKNELLLEMKNKSEKDLEDARGKITELEKENQSYKKSIFGLYKKSR